MRECANWKRSYDRRSVPEVKPPDRRPGPGEGHRLVGQQRTEHLAVDNRCLESTLGHIPGVVVEAMPVPCGGGIRDEVGDAQRSNEVGKPIADPHGELTGVYTSVSMLVASQSPSAAW